MYYIFFIFAFIFLLSVRPEAKKVALQLDFIGLFIFSALRYNFGNDYISYHNYFDQVKLGVHDLEIGEIGFYYLNKLFPNFYIMIAVL